MDFVGPVIDLVNRVWDCCGKHTIYLRDLQENLESLRISMEELRNLRDHVKQRVELAEAEQMVRTQVVQGWLQRVEAIEAEVEEILCKGQSTDQEKCMKTCCRCWRSYKLGKKVVKMLAIVVKGKGCNFDVVADRSNRPVVQEMPGSPTVGMDSLLQKALRMLKDDEVTIMGIYGMGGVGKTTLLKKINNEFLLLKGNNNDIDVVIWVVVSKELNLGRIQYEIAKRLGLPIHDERDHQLRGERANAIFNVLSHRKFVLLLDDCWERVDLKRIGIPHLHQAAGSKCKIVFTTRSEVVCGLMEAKKKMRVECLDPENAWRLFEEKVGEEALNSEPQVRELAEVVAKECCGLPLALITIGRTMASKKTAQEWKHAITVLKKYTSEFSGMGDEVFPLLKFSYDNLQNDTLRSCFLYCALYTEDSNIQKDHLILQWIGEGFLEGFESMDEAYDRGHDMIGSLKAVCLLENAGVHDSEREVKMHDVIRDLAMWISCECERKKDKLLIQPGANLSKAPPSEKWKEAERVSLMDNEITFLEDVVPVTCSDLLTLMLNCNFGLCDIGDDFFQFMPNLKVLNLSYTKITRLPTSISNLAELQLLNLSHSSIRELHVELKNLVKLKYLDLSYTPYLRSIPQRVISGLSNLQMLNLFISGHRSWETNEFGARMSLVEVERLERVSSLGITINSVDALEQFVNNKKFHICTRQLGISCPTLVSVNILPSSSSGATTSTLPRSSSLTSLSFGGMKNLQALCLFDIPSMEQLTISFVGVEKGTQSLISSLENLCLDNLPKLTIIWQKGLLSQYQCFQKLHTVCIYTCHALRDLSWLLYVSNLKQLAISRCNGLKSILKTNENMNPFLRLTGLRLRFLPKLESICKNALSFPSLELISVNSCPLLSKLPFDSNSVLNTLGRIEGSVEWWNRLQWEDENVKSSFQKYFH